MESIGRPGMGNNTNQPVAATSAVVGRLLQSPTRTSSVATITSNTTKTTSGLCHAAGNHRATNQHCGNGSNVIQHHPQYHPPLLVGPPPLVPSSLIHSTQTTGPLQLSTSSQLMLSSVTTTASGVLPQFQPQNTGRSHQLVTAPTMSATSIVVPTSNITTIGMALSPFGILPHERVVPHHTHHCQHRKLSVNLQSSKTIMETCSTSSTQILGSPVVNPQRFYIEPNHLNNKIKPYESIQQQQQQQQQRTKIVNGISDKSLPVVSGVFVPQSYEQRYQPRNSSQQVGYLSVITRTAGTSTNSSVMDDNTMNNNYYQTQPIPLQSKTSDNHDRQYYHFDSTVSTSQTPQQQLDNINLLMGSPVQRCDPMHIVKNLQSMQTDIDCYGIKKVFDQPRLLATSDNNKTVGSANVLNNNSKNMIEHQHLQLLPKSSVIDPSSSYNSQYFANKRQPPPAHLHQHHNQSHMQQHITGSTKILPTPPSLTVVSANCNAYLDVQQPQRHQRWNLDQQKSPSVSTSSGFFGNISSSVFHQSSLQQQQQQYSNTVSTFNIQTPSSNIHHHQQTSQIAHQNNFIVSSVNPTYYSPTTTIVSSTVTSETTSSALSSLYNRQLINNQLQQHQNAYHDFTNNLQGGSCVLNNDNRSPSLPHVIVPDIEQELSYLSNDSTPTTTTLLIKPLNAIVRPPSFIDSYIKFIHGGADNLRAEEELNEKPKKLLHLSASTPKPISKPYIPLSKPRIVSLSVQTSSRNGSSEDKKIGSVTTATIDDDPRYFPLPKTSSSIAGISDDSNGGNSWMSGDDDQDQWWTTSSKGVGVATPMIKNKTDIVNKKRKNNNTVKKKRTTVTAAKKPKIQPEEQPRRQLSHRLAKEKTQKLLSSINGELDLDDDDLLSDGDSDIDPAWIPNSDDNDSFKNPTSIANRRQFSHKKYSRDYTNSVHPPTTSSLINNNNNDHLDDSTDTIPFKSGSFVALKSQYAGQVTPQQLWRVDGKSLLQKFQRLNNDIYKSVPTYTGWSSAHYDMYCQVAVEFVSTYNGINVISNKSSTEIFVQILSDDHEKSAQNDSIANNVEVFPPDNNQKLQVDTLNSMSSSNSADDQTVLLRANFDVYIQTLASQALDSNFLEEIYRDNDEFFLSNVRAIEKMTQTWLQATDSAIRHLLTDSSKIDNVRSVVSKYSIIEVCQTDKDSFNNIQLCCIVCGCQRFLDKQQKFVNISLSGTEYNSRTLQNIEDDGSFSKIVSVKKLQCCSNTLCADFFIITHSLEHLKYFIYKECCKRITTENSFIESNQDTTSVLNLLLADEVWIDKLFQMVCNAWSRAKQFVSYRQSKCRVSS